MEMRPCFFSWKNKMPLHTSKLLLAPTSQLCKFSGCRRACSEVCPLCKSVNFCQYFVYFIWQRLHVILWSFIKCTLITLLRPYSSLYHTCVAVQYVLHDQFLEKKNTIVRSKTMISSIVLSPAYFG